MRLRIPPFDFLKYIFWAVPLLKVSAAWSEVVYIKNWLYLRIYCNLIQFCFFIICALLLRSKPIQTFKKIPILSFFFLNIPYHLPWNGFPFPHTYLRINLVLKGRRNWNFLTPSSLLFMDYLCSLGGKCNRGDTMQYHGSLRSRELGQVEKNKSSNNHSIFSFDV